VDWKNHKTHWHEAVSSALNLPFLKEASQNCFVFDVVKFENEEVAAFSSLQIDRKIDRKKDR